MPGQPAEREPLDLAQFLQRRIAFHVHVDRHLLESGERRVRHHVAAHVEIRPRHRLEALIVDAQLRRVEREHRRVATDRARTARTPAASATSASAADVLRLADDEGLLAVARLDPLIEIADRRDLDLQRRLRSLRRAPGGIGAVARLPRIGDGFQLREAVAHGHGLVSYGQSRDGATFCAAMLRLVALFLFVSPPYAGARARKGQDRARLNSISVHVFLATSGTLSEDLEKIAGFGARNFRSRARASRTTSGSTQR